MKMNSTAWLCGFFIWIFSTMAAYGGEKITLFAAASLTNVLQELAKQYQESHRDVEIINVFASSSVLARQIEQGAPADLFISANQQWMDYLLEKQRMMPGSRHTLLGNNLVLIAPKKAKITQLTIDKSTDWLSLLADGHLAVGAPEHVPAGIYAKEALLALGAWQDLQPHLVGASNVRSAMALVARGEATLGIVYGSDVLASDQVKIVGIFPERSHQAIEYPLAVVKDKERPQVMAFYHYLQSAHAATLFKRFGFVPR